MDCPRRHRVRRPDLLRLAVRPEKKAEKLAIARAYQAALDYLAQHPTDPQARLACLERGRVSYATTIPDTFTLVVGESG